MKNGIYIRPAVVRLAVLPMVAGLVIVLRSEVPVARRYFRFETM